MYSSDAEITGSASEKRRHRGSQARDTGMRSPDSNVSGRHAGPLLPLIRRFELDFLDTLLAMPASLGRETSERPRAR